MTEQQSEIKLHLSPRVSTGLAKTDPGELHDVLERHIRVSRFLPHADPRDPERRVPDLRSFRNVRIFTLLARLLFAFG